MTGRPRRRVDALCALLGRDPRAPLPRDIDAALADRLVALAIAGATPSELSSAAGDAVYIDGYARRRLAEFPFLELVTLARGARERLEHLDQQIGPLALKQRRLVHLLTSATSIDDDGDTPIADDEQEPAAATVTPENPAAAPIANTTKTKRSIE